MGRHGMFLGLFMLSLFVMMNCLAVMVRRCLVMSGSRVMVFACGVFIDMVVLLLEPDLGGVAQIEHSLGAIGLSGGRV